MDLQKIEQDLAKQLEQDPAVEVKQIKQYSIPVHTLQVSYHPIMRNAMDILMKMMLISFQKAKLKNVELLADILLVEPLFIHDLTNKMLHLGMITKEEVFSLTEKGQAQLQSGIFEEELELTNYFVQYSPLHKTLMEGDLENLMDIEQFPDNFPYMESEEIGEIEESLLVNYIQKQLSNEPVEEDAAPLFITSVKSTESIQIYDVPIICFVLYHKNDQRFIPRIYNTLTGAWDETIEAILLENEKEDWQLQ